MKNWIIRLATSIAVAARDFQSEIELAFLHFDSDSDGYVTKH